MPQGSGRFSRRKRLTRPKEFDRVFKDPKRTTDRNFTVLFRANRSSIPRLGLAIAKRRVPRAVARHRIKRQIRESFRVHQRLLEGLDLVVLVRTNLEPLENRDLRVSLEWHWQQVHERCKGLSSDSSASTAG